MDFGGPENPPIVIALLWFNLMIFASSFLRYLPWNRTNYLLMLRQTAEKLTLCVNFWTQLNVHLGPKIVWIKTVPIKVLCFIWWLILVEFRLRRP